MDGFSAHMGRVSRKGWRYVSRAEPTALLRLTIAVKQFGVLQLEEKALAVSDPRNAAYGKYLSNAAVHALLAPSPASLMAVQSWLAAHNVTAERLTSNSDFLGATVSVTTAEQLLNTSYGVFVHSSGARVVRASAPYSVPADVASR